MDAVNLFSEAPTQSLIAKCQQDLVARGFCLLKGGKQLKTVQSEDWLALKSAFSLGEADGPSRCRFYSRFMYRVGWPKEMFKLDVNSEFFLGSTYRQTADLNPEQQGKYRHYAPVPKELWQNRLMKELILFDLSCVPFGGLWRNFFRNPLSVGVHLIRMVATPGAISVASPCVPHQDGEPFTCIHVINRCDVVGGVSQVFKNAPVDNFSQPGELLSEVILEDELDSLIIWDKKVFHHVTPVEVKPGSEFGYRDVLIIDFAPFEECRYDTKGVIGVEQDAFIEAESVEWT